MLGAKTKVLLYSTFDRLHKYSYLGKITQIVNQLFSKPKDKCVIFCGHRCRKTGRGWTHLSPALMTLFSPSWEPQCGHSSNRTKYQSYLPRSLSDDSALPSPPFPWSFVSPFPRCPGVLGPVSAGQHLPWWKWSQWERVWSCHSCRTSRAGGYCDADSGAVEAHDELQLWVWSFLPVFVLFGLNSHETQLIRRMRWCNIWN